MQERAERTRNALLTAAAAVFDRLGYERATLAEVSETAAVSRGALSFHFSNKSELADSVQSLACASSRDRMEALKRRDVPALQTLIDMTHSAVQQLTDDPVTRAGIRLSVERATPHDPSLHCRITWREAFRDTVQRAAADRSLRSGLVARTVARLALSLVNGAYEAHTDDERPAREWLSETWEILLPVLADEDCAWPFSAHGTTDGTPTIPGQRNAERCSDTHCE
ncbi:ScbR family autoregulator-binding transcription factor [Streptomyces macrosporus]|uniref:ScbR family autoregulator-binding transcription factor n=1 Tax=Streptomyces macrosporus TaxID=44032 RepID=A0ABP5WL77_9ACTN